MGGEILKPHEAAKEIGCSAQCVRLKMRRGIWDLGYATPPKRTGKQQWEYDILRWKLDHFLGKDQLPEGGETNG